MAPVTRTLRLLVVGLASAAAIASCGAFAPAANAQTSGSFGKNKIAYRQFDWKIYHSPHFNLYYYESEKDLLEKVASIAESAYDRLSRDFNYQIKDPVPLIFYATHSAFEQNNIILNFIPEGVGAFASPARFRMVMPVDLPDGELMALMLHELTHIFQYHILFQGRFSAAVATSPPTWFMEGMASYMAKDESSRDRMFLRDAVVNDRIPSVTRDFGGFFAYRFGHAVFDFIEERWGRDGFLDFVYETRNSLGSRVDRAIKRTFKLDPEDFDAEFRRWLRKKYLPQLIETGEPGDFGRPFRVREREEPITYELSPVASPSGDLVAAFSTFKGESDIVLFDSRKRRLIRNLTRGFSTRDYQYPVAQELELGRKFGRDIAFGPDGNQLAVFVKREAGRSLALLNVLEGGIDRVIEMKDIEQQLNPSFSPDGSSVVFSGWQAGRFDLFSIDLASLAVTKLTDDEVYDGAPVYSPDGKSLVFVSVVGSGSAKLFRMDLAEPGKRYQITDGESNENDPTFSPDGKRLYFTSDRDGAENIYGLDLATGELRQHTNVVTGASMPTVLKGPEGRESLVYTGFWKGVFDLYVTDLEEKIGEPETKPLATEPTVAQDLPKFEPDIQVAIDESNVEKYGRGRFFLEDAQSFVGVDDNQTVLGQVYLSFSDYLGDKRIYAYLSSVESFSNFDVTYANLSRRLQWQVNLFDTRLFYTTFFPGNNDLRRGTSALQLTGLVGSIVYPFSFYNRAELGAGYIRREINFRSFVIDDEGFPVEILSPRKDDFPIVQGALVSDSTISTAAWPITGHRVRFDAQYAPDPDGGTLYNRFDLDARKYFALTQRSSFALRAFAGVTDGNSVTPYVIGGLDTVRGVDFRSLVGDRAFFTNLEFRFPLIDALATPILGIQGVRGILFVDVGGAWFNDTQTFDFYDSDAGKFEDAVASYGWGVSARIFGPFDFNWDFAKPFKSKTDTGGFRTSFWLGARF